MQQAVKIHGLSFLPYLQEKQIVAKIKQLAALINNDYKYQNPLLIGVLNGAAIFTADLIRELNITCELCFIRASSYHGLKTSGNVCIEPDINTDITNRAVLLIEDIIDTGTTAIKLIELLKSKAPASLSLITFLLKPGALKHNITPNYVGFEIPNIFVVGYGMDYNGEGRNLKDIYALKH